MQGFKSPWVQRFGFFGLGFGSSQSSRVYGIFPLERRESNSLRAVVSIRFTAVVKDRRVSVTYLLDGGSTLGNPLPCIQPSH